MMASSTDSQPHCRGDAHSSADGVSDACYSVMTRSELLHTLQTPLNADPSNHDISVRDELIMEDLIDPISKASAGLLSSIANICNAVLGAGILALPFAYSRSGWIGGPILICLSGFLNALTMHMLSRVGRKLQGDKASFHGIAAVSLPSKLWWMVDAAVIALMLGLSASYLIVFGNLTSKWMQQRGNELPKILETRLLWVSVGLAFVAPMSYAKTLDALRFTSAIAVALVCFVCIAVVAYWAVPNSQPCASTEKHCGGKVSPLILDLGFLQSLALSCFAFTAHIQVLPVSNELKHYQQRRMDSVIITAIVLCSTLYCLVGYAGYSTFGNKVNGDLLESYQTAIPVTLARLAISAVVAFSYPLMAQPLAHSAISLLTHQTLWPSISAGVKQHPELARFAITTFSLFATYSVALCVTDLGLVLSILGSTASTTIAYIVPTLAFIRVFDDHKPLQANNGTPRTSLLALASSSSTISTVQRIPGLAHYSNNRSYRPELLRTQQQQQQYDGDNEAENAHVMDASSLSLPVTEHQISVEEENRSSSGRHYHDKEHGETRPRCMLIAARCILCFGICSVPLSLAATFT